MSILYFLEVQSNRDDCPTLSKNDLDNLIACSRSLPNLKALNFFTPEEGGHDPFLKDANPPLLVIQAVLFNEECLTKILVSSELLALIEQLLILPVDGLRVLQEAMLLDPFMSSDTRAGLADVSYLVNYTRPAEDEAAFLQYYRDHHPAILMNFPDIRRVELGLPIAWTPTASIEQANRMLYCEVSFDCVESLNTALNSDVRAELRKDYECFPPFSGAVTHFAMHRQTLI